MPQKPSLSNRLTQVASFLPSGANFCDVGSDHAYLPCYVCMQDQTAKAIAGEVNAGPCDRAEATVQAFQLSDRIDVRLGDGLQVIGQGEVSQLVIAGMGGALIRSILENGKEKLAGVERIITQPNVDAKGVRKWFVSNDYHIKAEDLVEEHGHFYEIVMAEKAKTTAPFPKWTEKELLFGPVLLAERSPEFFGKWQYELNKLTKVVEQMKQAKIQDEAKISKLELESSWIQEVLRYDAYHS